MEIFALLGFLIAFLGLFIPRTPKGMLGEKIAARHIRKSLNPNTYQSVHDLIIPSRNGTAQIDHLLVSAYGLFIVETKNISGWIFGSENQTRWTQSLYGKNYSFQNPVRQTFRQKKVLSEYLNIDERIIHTVIYFVGNCQFKTDLPPNVIRSRLGSHIKQYQTQLLSPEEVDRIFQKLDKLVSEFELTTEDHIESLSERHNSETNCPRCGSELVERTARKGSRVGSKFLGCAGFPKCRYTKNMT